MGEFSGRPSDKAVDLSKVVPKKEKIEEKITNTIRGKNFTISASEGFFRISSKNNDMELDVDFSDKDELIKLIKRI